MTDEFWLALVLALPGTISVVLNVNIRERLARVEQKVDDQGKRLDRMDNETASHS